MKEKKLDNEPLAISILAKCLQLPVNKIKTDHTIHDLKDIDSVEFALIIAEIEKTIKTELTVEQLLTLDSVHNLVNILDKNI